MSWYVLQHRNELKARDVLAERGFYGYVPMETLDRRRGRKITPVERPVWRGYVFVLCGPGDLGAVLAATAGHLVRVEMQPITLPLSALDLIIEAEALGHLDSCSHEYVPSRSDHVRIKSGKWQSFLGRIISIGRRKVLLEMEKGSVRMEIDPQHLELVA